MKLLSYTYRKLALLLFLLMAVWGVLFYYAIIDEVVDETDDTLENYGEILMEVRFTTLDTRNGRLVDVFL